MKIDTLYQPKLSASGKVTVAVCFAFLGNAAVAAISKPSAKLRYSNNAMLDHRQHCRTDRPKVFPQPI